VKEGWDCQQFQLLYMYISSNIPIGLLVDCCYESVQQFFSCSYFLWLQFLKLCGYAACSPAEFLSGEGYPPQNFRLRNDLYCVGWGVKLYSLTYLPATTGGGIPQWRHAWGRVEAPQAPRGWVLGRGGGYAIVQQELIT